MATRDGGTSTGEAAAQKDLDRLSSELLERLSREEVGPPATAASHLVGRLVKAGSALENLLRTVVVYVATREGRQPEELLAPVGGRKPSLRKSMAGPLAHGLRLYFSARPSSTIPARVGVIINDLLQERSVILSFIAVRNNVAKEDGDPETGRAATAQLKRTIVEFRRQAGWK